MTALLFPAFRPSTRWLALAILALFLAGTTGCVSMDEHKRLQTAFDECRAQLAAAENDVNAKNAQIEELKGEIARLNRLLEQNGGNAALLKERDLLAQRVAELQKQLDALAALNGGKPALPEPINDKLRRLVDQYPDLLEFDERLGMVRFKSDLTFDLGSTVVKPRAKEALAKFATILNDPLIAENEITVMGHTDDVPIHKSTTMQLNPTNWILSTNRSWSVSDVLHANGVSDARVQAAGWGDQRPIAPNAPGQKGSEKNRRVDIYIRPTKVPEGIIISTPGAARSTPAPTHRTTPSPRAPVPPRTPPATMPSPTGLPSDMVPQG